MECHGTSVSTLIGEEKKKTWRYSCGDNEQRNRVDKWLDICGKKLTRWRGDKERRIYI